MPFQMSGYRPLALPQGVSLGYHPQMQQIGNPMNAINLQRMQLPQSMLAPPQAAMQQTRPAGPTNPTVQKPLTSAEMIGKYGSRR